MNDNANLKNSPTSNGKPTSQTHSGADSERNPGTGTGSASEEGVTNKTQPNTQGASKPNQ